MFVCVCVCVCVCEEGEDGREEGGAGFLSASTTIQPLHLLSSLTLSTTIKMPCRSLDPSTLLPPHEPFVRHREEALRLRERWGEREPVPVVDWLSRTSGSTSLTSGEPGVLPKALHFSLYSAVLLAPKPAPWPHPNSNPYQWLVLFPPFFLLPVIYWFGAISGIYFSASLDCDFQYFLHVAIIKSYVLSMQCILALELVPLPLLQHSPPNVVVECWYFLSKGPLTFWSSSET